MEHIVQFFDLPETLGASVGRFVHDSVLAGRTTLIVARPSTVNAMSQALSASGVSLQELIESGAVVVRDAATVMRGFMGTRSPRADDFDASVGSLVRQLAADAPGGLSIYGEMVDILAAEGNFDGAEQLEHLWNHLGETMSFQLLCGYAAAHFAGSAAAQERLKDICRLHSSVRQDSADLLANWLLSNTRPAN